MSYLPKYVMKRMFKKDCVKKTDTGASMTIVNVITPLSADLAPTGDILDYLQITIQGRKLTKEEMANIKLEKGDVKATLGTFSDIGIVAVGDQVVFYFDDPEVAKLNVGDVAKIGISIVEVGTEIELERELA